MSDYSELKRLAEAALNDCGDYVALNDYGMAVPPAVVLELIAENERLSSMQSAFFENLEKLEGLKPFAPHELGKHLIDIAMDRIEALRKEAKYWSDAHSQGIEWPSQLIEEREALRKDAERYRWLRDKSEALHQFYLSVPLWFPGVVFRRDDVDNAIDKSMERPDD